MKSVAAAVGTDAFCHKTCTEGAEEYYNFEDSSSDSTSGQQEHEVEGIQYLHDKSTEVNSLSKFPTVAKMFVKYNTILPSSAPVERLFSYGGMLLRPHRRNMSDDVFEALLCIKSNRKCLNVD